MRVGMYYNNHDIRIEEIDIPSVGKGEILMKVVASGICGSDLMEWYRVPKAPIVLGHEVAGEVVEVDEGVEKFKVGDRVVTTHHVPCDSCHYCLTDRHTVCNSIKTTYFEPGGFSEYLRIPSVNVEKGTFHLDDNVSYDAGSFTEPLGCVVRAHRLADYREGSSICVIGSGITGILNIQYSILNGSGNIFALDINDNKLNKAMDFGATAIYNSTKEKDVKAEILKINNGQLIDVVIVCTGAYAAIDQVFELVDKGGTIIFFAPTDPDFALNINFNDWWWSGVRLLNSYAAAPKDLLIALQLITSKRIDVEKMITDILPLDEIAKGFGLVENSESSLKVIIRPQS